MIKYVMKIGTKWVGKDEVVELDNFTDEEFLSYEECDDNDLMQNLEKQAIDAIGFGWHIEKVEDDE